MPRPLFPLLSLPMLLAGCDAGTPPPTNPAAAPREGDPLVRAVMAGPLLSDPGLVHLANADAVRPPDLPLFAPVPAIDVVPAGPASADVPALPDAGDCPACAIAARALTLDALAERSGDPRMRACVPAIRYSAAWAARMPQDLPLPASARVIEAAGADGDGCRLRAVGYGAAVPFAPFLAAEAARAGKAGYRVAYQAGGGLHALLGQRPRDGAAFALFARADGGLVDARLVTNDGS